MNEHIVLPGALTIAGSDSGGGAGIQADLKTFAALCVHGTSVITCVTAQNPRRVIGIQPIKPQVVRQQLEAVFAELPPKAVKTGMLFSTDIIRVVANFFKAQRNPPPLIVDPVMIATSGAELAGRPAIQALKKLLLPLATLVTPNLYEAEVLSGSRVKNPEHMRAAAEKIHAQFGCAVLVKGGHLAHPQYVFNYFFDGAAGQFVSGRRIVGVGTHGTGCVLSAAVAAYIARGEKLETAVNAANCFVVSSIAESFFTGRRSRHTVLNPFWYWLRQLPKEKILPPGTRSGSRVSSARKARS